MAGSRHRSSGGHLARAFARNRPIELDERPKPKHLRTDETDTQFFREMNRQDLGVQDLDISGTPKEQ